MEKYKLINSVTKIETLCEKVTIDGFDYYVSDEEILDTDSYLNLEIKPNGQKNPFWGKIYKKYSITKDEKYEKYILQFCKKVIATNNPYIDVPKVLDEVERLAIENSTNKIPTDIFPDASEQRRWNFEGFVEGYNKSQETHPFSDEDMIELIRFITHEFNVDSFQNRRYRDSKHYATKELLQLWKEQRPKIVYYG